TIWSAQVSLLLARFWHPTSNLTFTRITATPASGAVARHEPLNIEAKLSGRLRKHANLMIRKNDGPEQSIPLVASQNDPTRCVFTPRKINLKSCRAAATTGTATRRRSSRADRFPFR